MDNQHKLKYVWPEKLMPYTGGSNSAENVAGIFVCSCVHCADDGVKCSVKCAVVHLHEPQFKGQDEWPSGINKMLEILRVAEAPPRTAITFVTREIRAGNAIIETWVKP